MATSIPSNRVHTIVVACEAGMGSSVMSVNALRKKLTAAKVDNVVVAHKAARSVAGDAQVILVHRGLAGTVRRHSPDAVVLAFDRFLNDPVFDDLVQTLVSGRDVVERL